MTTFLKRKWQTVVLFMLVFATLAFVFSVVQPQKYRSEQRFLVVSAYAEDVDPYAATRSTEYLTNLLSEIMYSQNFLNEVMNSGYALDESIFPEDARKKKKAWAKSLRTRVLGDTGILDITIYHKDRFVTEQLALAVGAVLRTEHAQYHSRAGAVTIQTIDQPITSLRPVQPNILLNTVAGLALGILAGLAFIYLFPDKEFKFSSKGSHRLVDATEPDWSTPLAIPSGMREVNDTMAVYEAAEMKYPTTGAYQKTAEIGYQLDPPANLPIA